MPGAVAFPAEANKVHVGGPAFPVPFDFGWLFLDLNAPNPASQDATRHPPVLGGDDPEGAGAVQRRLQRHAVRQRLRAGGALDPVGRPLCYRPGNGFLDYRDGVLCMEGVPLAELAERLGTPFFLLSEARLLANYRALERGLSRRRPALLRQDQPRGGGAGDAGAVRQPSAGQPCRRGGAGAALRLSAGADRLRAAGADAGGAGRGAARPACR